jgi:hypothetical protein
MQATHDLGAAVADVDVAFRQQAQHPSCRPGEPSQLGMPQRGERHRTASLGSVLFDRVLPNTRVGRQRRRDIDDPFTGRHKLLGQQIAEPVGPRSPTSAANGSAHASSRGSGSCRSHRQLRQFDLAIVDGERGATPCADRYR